MKIGIDFGSLYTKIAYPDKNHNPQLFIYPNEETGQPYIPTEISYTPCKGNFSRFIGVQAFDNIIGRSRSGIYRDLRNNLLLTPIEPHQFLDKDGRTPFSIAHDYFEELLLNGRYPFNKGKIEQVLVSIPEVWYRDTNNLVVDQLLNIFEQIVLSRENIQLQSEPVCAAAFYAYAQRQNPKVEKTYNLLVCDMGSSTFDVTLCMIEKDYIRVLLHDSSSGEGTGFAGAAFDRACVNLACYSPFERNPENLIDLYRYLRVFENEKINPKEDNIRLVDIENPVDNLYSDEIVYSFDGFNVKVIDVWKAFLPIRNEIRNVLQRVQEKCSQNNLKIDRIFVVGGFGQCPLVQQTISNCLTGISEVESESNFLKAEHSGAIAKGGCYIVNEMIQVAEPFEHTVGIVINGLINGLLNNMEVPVIQKNQARAGMTTPQFATIENNGRLIVNIPLEHNDSLPIYIQNNSNGINRFQKIQDWPPPGDYSVGFHIDRLNKAKLIFEKRGTNEQYLYPVEDLHAE